MKTKLVGQTGMQVSTITFGCWELGGGPWELTSDENNMKVIESAFEMGITTFDTAEGYGSGHSEEVVGAALEGKRKDVIISTKVSRAHLAPDDVRRSAEASLKRLRTDYLDIYYIHWPSFDIPVGETLGEFNKLKEEGLIRAIGVSNFSLAQLKEAANFAQIDIIQPEYSLLHRAIEEDVLPHCERENIAIMSYSSIAKGILTGAFHVGGKQLDENDFRSTRRLFLPEHLKLEEELILLMKEIADTRNKTIAQIAISWLLHQNALTTAIIGSQSIKHMKENVEAVDIQFSSEELNALDTVSRKVIAAIDSEQ
ncbi:aldo/keto reductase [Paenibacillus xerothermodurans]|uniref:Aldo/keto reductase n=1 Tax=Paenibacillus xerothermodurans TaxID=1977292 RepID=A0A2W1NCZ7_PAEXE|nr:aldo/keto reductase [Paenibacillus xerothermodurans]PZE22367.1 aldo/keto reductase [Paenibacillus xerothermodurans]